MYLFFLKIMFLFIIINKYNIIKIKKVITFNIIFVVKFFFFTSKHFKLCLI